MLLIPCVITALDEANVRHHVANTMTYRGAKRLVKKIRKFDDREFRIDEAWHNPILQSRNILKR